MSQAAPQSSVWSRRRCASRSASTGRNPGYVLADLGSIPGNELRSNGSYSNLQPSIMSVFMKPQIL
eukprot:919533-Alexandrium_andersonii.AAC.1